MIPKPPIDSLIRFRHNGHEATVTQHTERGFKYLLAREYPFIPRWGMSFAGEGEIYTDMPEYDWAADVEYIEAFSPESDPHVALRQLSRTILFPTT